MTRISSLVLACLFAVALAAQTAPVKQSTPSSPQTNTAQPAASQSATPGDENVIDATGGEPIKTEPDQPKVIRKIEAVAPTGPRTVRWNPPAAGVTAASANMSRIVSADGIKIIVSLKDYPQYNFTRVNLEVANASGHAIAVDPSKVTLEEVQPASKVLRQLDARKLASSVEVQDYQANSADQMHGNGDMMNAGLGPGQMDVGGKSRSAMIRYGDRDFIFTDFVRETSLKKGELATQQRAVGGIYYRLAKESKQSLLKIPIGELTFEVPLDPTKK